MTTEDDAITDAQNESDNLDNELTQMAAALGVLFFGIPTVVVIIAVIIIQALER